MILCKYFDEYGEDVLRDSRLKVSRAVELNDPFEFVFSLVGEFSEEAARNITNDNDSLYKKLRMAIYNAKDLSETERNEGFRSSLRLLELPETLQQINNEMYSYKNLPLAEWNKKFEECFWKYKIWKIIYKAENARKQMKQPRLTQLQKTFDSTRRLICFSIYKENDPEEILMWSHYSNKHQGLRIHFDTNKIKLLGDSLEVNYDEILEEDINEFFGRGNSEILNKILYSKGKVWKYEKEYRLVVPINDCDLGSKVDFREISSEAIVRVDIGCKATDSFRTAIISILKEKRFEHVEIREAERDDVKHLLKYIESK